MAPRKRVLTPGKAKEAKPAPETPAQPVAAGSEPKAAPKVTTVLSDELMREAARRYIAQGKDPADPAEQAPKDARPLGEQDDAEIDNRVCGTCGQLWPRKTHEHDIGRPSTYDPAVVDRILALVAEGSSLRRVCRAAGMPASSTFLGWVLKDTDGLSERYARARDLMLEAMADDIIEIADESNADVRIGEKGQLVVDGEVTRRSEIKASKRQWLLSKLKPETYGDRMDMRLSGSLDINRLDDQQLTMTLENHLISLGVPDEILLALRPYITVIPLPDRSPLSLVAPVIPKPTV